MSGEMERVLLTHCAPTLAGLKCANLVRLTGPRAELEAAAQAWRATLAPRGVHVRTARQKSAGNKKMHSYKNVM